jgi:putative transposase
MSSASFYKWRSKYGGIDASLIIQMKAMEDENRRLNRMYSDLRMQAVLLFAKGGAWKKVTGPSQRREMAAVAVEQRGVPIGLACRVPLGSARPAQKN